VSEHNTIDVNTLFEKYGEKLCLHWIAGKQGSGRLIYPEQLYSDSGPRPLCGQMNPVNPQQIPIIGSIELQYLDGLTEQPFYDTINQLISNQPACILIAEDKTPPAFLSLKCNEQDIPLLTSPLTSHKLIGLLQFHLTDMLVESVVLNGVFMEVMNMGTLITGASGIGKSELALELIARGHRLIADDATKFSRLAPEIITGTCPELLKDFLEVRGLGIINVRKIYGDNSIKDKKHLSLIVRLEPMERSQLLSLDRLDGSYNFQNILDVDITEIILPVAPGRNLAIMLECAVRNYMLRIQGYNAPEEFINKQLELIKKNCG